MKQSNRSANACLWAVRGLFGLMLALAVAMPWAVQWYGERRELTGPSQWGILMGYYLCMIPAGMALGDMGQLLRRIRAGEVFLMANVRLIRRLTWYCGAVSVITLVCGYFYPPLLFITVIMAFLCLVIGVVASVMCAATELREENDLTI